MSAALGWSVPLHCSAMIARQVVVMIPAAMIELNEADAALGQPPREQAVGGKRAGLARLRPVHLEDRVGLLREIRQLGHRRLHPVRHLVLRDARLDLRIAGRVVLHRVRASPAASSICRRVVVLMPGGSSRIQHRIARRCGTSRPDSSTAGTRCPTAARRAADRR